MFSSELLRLKFLGPLTPRLQILDDDGEGVLDTNVIALDLEPESEGDLVLGPDFDEASPGFDSSKDLALEDNARTN